MASNDSTVLDIQYVLMLPSMVFLKMEKLTFIIQSGFRIDPNKMKSIDKCLIAENELKVSNQLIDYIKQINDLHGYILVTIEQDGVTFKNELNVSQPLWNKIMDKLFYAQYYHWNIEYT